MTTKLTTIIEKDSDMYVALCPELGVVSQGHTVGEARENLTEALELFFEFATEREIERRLRGEIDVAALEIHAGPPVKSTDT